MSTSTSGQVIEAIRQYQENGDRWRLGDELAVAVPAHASNGAFKNIADDTADAGLTPLSVNTMRLYRDASLRWPVDKRVSGVGHSAHREALNGQNTDEARDMLLDLSTKLGSPGKVTVSAVRKAIAANAGKPIPAGTTQNTLAQLSDLLNHGGAKLLTAIKGAKLNSGQLDTVHASLSAVLTEVEALRVKANRRKAASKSAPVKSKPTNGVKVVAAKAAPIGASVGDLRDL